MIPLYSLDLFYKISLLDFPHTCVAIQEPATEGTVKAHANFNAETDARALRDAMKGFGERSDVRCHACSHLHSWKYWQPLHLAVRHQTMC